jgi:hypothetical protein
MNSSSLSEKSSLLVPKAREKWGTHVPDFRSVPLFG